MATSRHEGNLHVVGRITSESMTIPDSTVTDDTVASDAGIGAEKLQHQYQPRYFQSGTAAAATAVLHVVQGDTATLMAVDVGSVVAAVGDSTVTVDVKKNGTTVLSGTVQLDSGNSAYVPEAGTVSVSNAVDGDVYTAVVTVSAGTGTLPTGLYVALKIREDAD
jgi:hypothetical protein